MDSVAPETPIRDIVDRCRLWESHADSDSRRFGRPGPERALPIYTVDDEGGGSDDRVVVAVTTSPTAPPSVGDFAQTAASHPEPVPSDLEQLLQWLPGAKTGITAIDTLLQNLLPAGPGPAGPGGPALRTQPGPCVGTGLQWCVSRVANRPWCDPVSCTLH